MDKRYQVFISSTFTDLEEERRAVSDALLQSDCFPAQMENWPAMDAEQMEAIKTIIDDSDYYVIISAGKYGSISPDTGLSYTEMEYDYAVQTGKPIVRLLHRDPFQSLRGDRIEETDIGKQKLRWFHQKLKEGRMCSFWENPHELMLNAVLGLRDVVKRHPRKGWVRADSKAKLREQYINSELVKKLAALTGSGSGSIDFENLPVPILELDAVGRIVSSNVASRRLLSLKGELPERLDQILDGLGPSIQDWLAGALSGRDKSSTQFLRARADRDVFVQVTLNKSQGPQGPHFVAVVNDVTELKTLEAEFVQSQKMQAVGQLAAGVAHDFNNLITAIRGHCDLLLLQNGEDSQAYEDLVQIHQNAGRAMSLSGQLLAFARKQNFQTISIDLADTLSDLAHLLDRLVGEIVDVKLELEAELAPIRADKRQIEQVIMNLVVNARDAMPKGGQVVIRVEKLVVQDQEDVPAGDYVAITVKDDGVGIPPDQLPRIFEPFFTTKRPGEGVGLGLSTVDGIVKQTGGHIRIKSEVGKGTEILLLFAADTTEGDISRNRAAYQNVLDGRPDSSTVTILVVCYDDGVRQFVAKALELRRYDVVAVASGEDALLHLNEGSRSFDLTVSDALLGGLNGKEWISRALNQKPDLGVVILSDNVEDQSDDHIQAMKNAVVLSKPFSLGDLANAVSAIVSRLA